MDRPTLIKGQLVTFAYQEWTIDALNKKQESVTLNPTDGGRDRIVVWSPEIVPVGYDISTCTECHNTYLIDTQFTIRDARGTAIFCQECKRCRKIIRNRPVNSLNDHPHLYKHHMNFHVHAGTRRSGIRNKHTVNTGLLHGGWVTED